MSTIRRGSVGPDVRRWQRQLTLLGFATEADAVFGSNTEGATIEFQRSCGLEPDGIVGPLTAAAADRGAHVTSNTSAGEVARTSTPLNDDGIETALSEGHVTTFATLPSHPRLGCAFALVALENAHGKAIWCNNFGNISAFGGWPGQHYVIRVQERVKRNPDVWKWVDMKFRAYPDSTSGAADLWRLLAGRYASALLRMDAGDPEGAAHELGRLGYYTAHVEQYARTMGQLYRAWNG